MVLLFYHLERKVTLFKRQTKYSIWAADIRIESPGIATKVK
jgi:hypothetical protein